jgi:hypothetical protein
MELEILCDRAKWKYLALSSMFLSQGLTVEEAETYQS